MKPTAILCSDLHFRDTQPSCRTDDFWEAQIFIMDWLKDLQIQYDCPGLCSGDYFHHWKPSPRLLSACIEHMPFVYTIPGNHDLPNHSLDLIEKSGLWTLQKAGKVDVWETKLDEPFFTLVELRDIAIIHTLINHPQSGTSAKALIKKMPGYDLILTGDNHQTFTEEHNGQLLVNPGSISRQTAEQISHKPCVYLWYAEDNHVEQVFIPIKKRVISRKHLKRVEERNERMDAFLDALAKDKDSGLGILAEQVKHNMLSYEDNLKAHTESNKVSEDVAKLIWESVEA